MDPLEIIAVMLGLANVTLVVRRSVLNYPFGIAMVMLYADIFFRAKLYSDALLQMFFLVVQLYGWWNWQRSRVDAGEVVVLSLPHRSRVMWLAGTALATGGWGWLMHRFTDAAFPLWDAGVAMLSVAAQILQSRRYFESWVLWIAVDVLAVGLYAARGLWLTAGLYAVFLVLASWGLIAWMRARRAAA